MIYHNSTNFFFFFFIINYHDRTTQKLNKDLQPPKNYNKDFNWQTYLSEIQAEACPESLFTNNGIGEFNWSNKISNQIEGLEQSTAQEAQEAQEAQAASGNQEKPVEKKDKSKTFKTIFMSYGREQSVTPWVRKVKKHIESKGYSVWMDEEEIGSGTNWMLEIGYLVLFILYMFNF